MKKYCHLCGALYITGKTQPWICSGCSNKSYTNSAPTVEIALFNNSGQVLLAKRALEPNKGKLDLPGGFIDYGEVVEQALERELKEELDLNPDQYTKPVYCLSWTCDYAFGKEVRKIVNLLFVAELKTLDIKSQDDVADVLFVGTGSLDDCDFSYPEYPKNIRAAYNRIFS